MPNLINTPIEDINVDALEFRVVENEPMHVSYEGKEGETISGPLNEGHAIKTQYDDVFIRSYRVGGHYDVGIAPDKILVVFIADKRIPVLYETRMSDDRKTKTFEIESFCGHRVTARVSGYPCGAPALIAEPTKFSSRKEQDVVVSMVKKALSDYFWGSSVKLFYKGTKNNVSKKEQSDLVKLLVDGKVDEYRRNLSENYDREDLFKRSGKSQCVLTNSCIEKLEQGCWLL